MNKQIEEMTNCLCDVLDFDYDDEIGVTKVDAKTTAEGLYNAGYRKASEVAKEIFADVTNAWAEAWTESEFLEMLKELKKKYAEGEG